MKTILFLHEGPATMAGLALACFNSMQPAGVSGAAAATDTSGPGSALDRAMTEEKLTWPERILPLDQDLDLSHYDLVVCFQASGPSNYSALPGSPALVRWQLPEPAEHGGGEAWLALCSRMRSLVQDLLEQGYLTCIVQTGANAVQVMDNLHEGIIAHDLKRRIFFFNRAAERITGFSRHEIIGRDCHDIFSGGICQNSCSFKALGQPHTLADSPYPLSITSKAGEERQLEMRVVEMRDFLDAPIGVVASFRDLTREMETASDGSEQFAGIIGRDPKMLEVYQSIKELASSNVAVLVQGESGTGKELVAHAIHNLGPRAKKLFVPINCGALPENLLEAELFGHVKGAFTGAIRDKKGRFQLADGGTIFLDEIGDISPAMQVKLLRVLQDGTFQRVGDDETITVDVRVISATNKDLRQEIKATRFREDLFYRICVAPISLPPLRDRKGDIPRLARFFLKNALKEEERDEMILAQDTIDALCLYDWPGNIRELQNAIRFLMVRCREEIARPHHLPESVLSEQTGSMRITTRKKRRQKLDREMVVQALKQTNNNRVQAARLLGVGRATLYRFLAKNDLHL